MTTDKIPSHINLLVNNDVSIINDPMGGICDWLTEYRDAKQVIAESLIYNDKIKEMSQTSLRLFRLLVSNIYSTILKNITQQRPQIMHNLHVYSKTLSMFDYPICGDDDKYETLVVSSILFCFKNIF